MLEKFSGSWYRLDNAGKLFPSIATTRCTTVFRISATLNENINIKILQSALNHLAPRLPYYQVNLKRGLFWYYLEKANYLPTIQEEKAFPCMYLGFQRSNLFPYRVIYYKRRISLEIAHFLTDGMGATRFLKSLLAEYFKLLKGIEQNSESGLLFPDETVKGEEWEDAFRKYSTETGSIPNAKLKTAMHFPFPLIERGAYYIITGIMPVEKVISKSREIGTSLNNFFLALYFESILEFISQAPVYLKRELYKPITMNVPVNLRSIFPSESMRNFFLSITPCIDPRSSILTFENIIESVSQQMKQNLDKNHLSNIINRNVKGETSLLIRLLPLFIKDAMMPFLYFAFGENLYTSSISNLGKITLPQSIAPFVDRFDFYPAPSRGNKIKATVVSYKDHLYFTFGKLTRVRVIERLFFRKLVNMGIPVKIETNLNP
ncbi:alcohol acetyltransferase [Chitinispirillum alkaliphilum]|nr:alcohol acetyltransferase [Chitinispirillum alkaliphilum]